MEYGSKYYFYVYKVYIYNVIIWIFSLFLVDDTFKTNSQVKKMQR